ncbi:hypothetical protein HYDPIDRAFT_166812 [Hydnomerulius pinastri MD-312]|nr:hypothetical protein HYDPIDRAFT_166812 [Hydnomerulius pinastri MD-312]
MALTGPIRPLLPTTAEQAVPSTQHPCRTKNAVSQSKSIVHRGWHTIQFIFRSGAACTKATARRAAMAMLKALNCMVLEYAGDFMKRLIGCGRSPQSLTRACGEVLDRDPVGGSMRPGLAQRPSKILLRFTANCRQLKTIIAYNAKIITRSRTMQFSDESERKFTREEQPSNHKSLNCIPVMNSTSTEWNDRRFVKRLDFNPTSVDSILGRVD